MSVDRGNADLALDWRAPYRSPAARRSGKSLLLVLVWRLSMAIVAILLALVALW